MHLFTRTTVSHSNICLPFCSVAKMRTINSNQCVKIPKDIKASVKARVVTITGARGTLKRSFKHLALDMYMSDKRTLKVEKWFGTKKELAAVRTVCSHIENMIKGKRMLIGMVG